MGLTEAYYAFGEVLRSRQQDIAAIQLAGRQEAFLTNEFAIHLWKHSDLTRFVYTNVGNKGERKYDIAILKGEIASPSVESLVECKYVRNRHRARPEPWGATDEIRGALTDIVQQIVPFCSDEHASLAVQLRSPQQRVYGLVFAACTVRDDDPANIKEDFFDKVLSLGNELKMRYYDLEVCRFDRAFEDVRVPVLDATFSVSLRTGLWVLR
jgi:hypothetical protein